MSPSLCVHIYLLTYTYLHIYVWVWIPSMEKAMAPHSSTLAWKILWTEEPGRLQSMGSLGVRHDWATSLSLSRIGEGNGNPVQCSCLENPTHGGAGWAAVYGVAQSRTRLKRLSSSSSCVLMSILRFQRKALGQLISNFKILDFVPAPLIYSKNLLYLFLQWTLHHI